MVHDHGPAVASFTDVASHHSLLRLWLAQGLQVRLGADRLDLAGELDEEVGDLVEPVAVLAFDLA
jgi:hypothetical protein